MPTLKLDKQLNKEITSWQERQIISETQAEQIRALYSQNKNPAHKSALAIFGILGASLIVGGIIMIFATNWDELSDGIRAFIAFLPLGISIAMTAFILIRKVVSDAWREGVAVFYAGSIYACIALIGQIYHVAGDFTSALLICSLLVLPQIYVLKSTMSSLIYIVGITVWACSSTGGKGLDYGIIYAVGLLCFAIPHLWYRFKENLYNVYSQLLLWCLVICGFWITILVLPFSDQTFVIICIYFSMIYLISAVWMRTDRSIWIQPPKIVGFAGSMVMLFIMSGALSEWFLGYRLKYSPFDRSKIVVVGLMAVLCIALIIIMFIRNNLKEYAADILIGKIFLISIALQFLFPERTGWFSSAEDPFSLSILIYLCINLYILGIGILKIIMGLQTGKFSVSSSGTFLVAFLLILRFFDTQFGFLARGISFIFIGGGFLTANVLIAKRIKRLGVLKNAENS